MTTIAVSDFRTHLNKFLRKVARGEEIVLTSRGYTVAHLLPPSKKSDEAKQKLKALRSKCHLGDIVSPIETEWDALK